MYVTLRVASNAENTPEFRKVLEAAKKFGLRLERVRSVANDARPRPWYAASVDNPQAAEKFLTAVQRSPAVDAAYLKPADAAP
jgi:hypothetical protein